MSSKRSSSGVVERYLKRPRLATDVTKCLKCDGARGVIVTQVIDSVGWPSLPLCQICAALPHSELRSWYSGVLSRAAVT